LKTLFDIGQEKEAGNEHSLLLEIGNDHCSSALYHKATNTIDRIRLTTFDNLETGNYLPAVLGPLKETAYRSVVVCSAFPQALLFPSKYFQKSYAALDLVYEAPAQDYFHDSIPEWQMVTAYSLPKVVSKQIHDVFPSAYYFHCYTPAIKIYNGYIADHQLSVHFTDQYFRVLLKKEAAIHLAQTYAYKTPLDVVYYLLNICYEFDLSQQDVFLILSGLVDKDSSLFTTLQQFFTNIHFAQQPETTLPHSPYPQYYFTSLYNLAACVL
jgi:hypothetical protein